MSAPPSNPAATPPMDRLAVIVFFLLPVLSLGAALSLAAYHAQPGAFVPAGPTTPPDYRPRPVTPVNGYLPAGRDDPTPAFDVRDCPAVSEVYDLYPAKDAIPALDSPRFIAAEEATWLAEDAPVLGLKIGEDVRCYPLAILNWHCLVQDRVAGQAVYVLWDPPSGLSLARRVRSAQRPMGMAGLGFRGLGLVYEKTDTRLWDLVYGMPICDLSPDGAPSQEDFDWLPLERMTWAAWRRLHGATRVLSRLTGYEFDYDLDPYAAAVLGNGEAENYWTSETLLAPESLRDPERQLPDKAMVLGFMAGGEQWAASLGELSGAGEEVRVETATGEVVLRNHPLEDRFEVTDEESRWLPQVRMLWYAWRAHFPDTRVWHMEAEGE